MLIERSIRNIVVRRATRHPVVAVLGPRQSGKTTLVRQAFPDHTYFSLEEREILDRVKSDPREFLGQAYKSSGIIIDEFQNYPELLSYMQGIVDNNRHVYGRFILTGSHNFLMNQAITQSLAGRVSLITLLPCSFSELAASKLLRPDINGAAFYGGYPDLVTHRMPESEFYSDYTNTYLERDVRQLTNVGDLHDFQRFMRLCAGRTGQILNIAALADDASISVPTVKKWLSVLEASYVIFLMQPYFNNFSKRMIKSPKLYFYDTGLACWLLRINSVDQLVNHYLRGGIIESMIISELRKTFYNYGQEPSIYYWRDSHGHEVDAVLDYGMEAIPIEIKASQTIMSAAFEGITYWSELAGMQPRNGYLVYAGTERREHSFGTLIGWQNVNTIVRPPIQEQVSQMPV